MEREPQVNSRRKSSIEVTPSASSNKSMEVEPPKGIQETANMNKRNSRMMDFTRSTVSEDPEVKLECANILQNRFVSLTIILNKIRNVIFLADRASAHLEAIIKLLVEDSGIKEDADLWESLIISLIREVVSAVDPNVKDGDSIDIRNYVKLKIIPGKALEWPYP
jgi:hypothetical protein